MENDFETSLFEVTGTLKPSSDIVVLVEEPQPFPIAFLRESEAVHS